MADVSLSSNDISWTKDGLTVIRNADLLRALVDTGKADFVRSMPDTMKVAVEAVTIDAHGDVVINDPRFKDVLSRAMVSGPVGLSEEDGENKLNLQGGCIENVWCPRKVEEML